MRLRVVLLCVALATPAWAEPAQQPKAPVKQTVPAQQKTQAKTKTEPKAAKQPAPATTTTTTATPAAPATPNPVIESYAALPLAQRVAIQADLFIIGDYSGPLTGEFSEAAIAAVRAFQKRKGDKETGVLNLQERAQLTVDARAKQTARGWRVFDDTATGVRLLVPSKMMPETKEAPNGTRFTSARGEMVAETFRVAQSGTTLASVFEQLKKPLNGRRVAQSSIQGDSFQISGLQNLKEFVVRGYARGDEVRGITILYDQALDGIMAPVVTAMTNAFAPFPSGIATPTAKNKVEYASGIAVSGDGHILADRDVLNDCQIITVAGIGGADRIAEDTKAGLVLLRVYGARRLRPLALAGESMKVGDLMLLGIASPEKQDGGAAVTAIGARLTESSNIDPMPPVGFTGAAALDAQGKLAGMITLKPALIATTGVAGPQAALTPVEAIRNFLDAQNVKPAASTVQGPDAAKAAIVRVICVRK